MSDLDDIGPDGLTPKQRAAGLAPRRHSVAAGVSAELATPLTEAELRTGGGYTPAISDVDCTPRPRYGESMAKFKARMAGYAREAGLVAHDVNRRNRVAALRGVTAEGQVIRVDGPVVAQVAAYFTQCACGWCGLRVADPEVARREYDAHACAASSLGDDAVSRAQAHAGKATMPAKRKAAVLVPALPADSPVEPTTTQTTTVDEAEQRFALLELGTKPQ